MKSNKSRLLIIGIRMAMAWTFLFAAYHQISDPTWSVAGFLNHTKTFHDVYAWIATPSIDPTLTFLVEYGHLLIGLSLLFGLFVSASAPIAAMLMVLYWTAHMDWPFIENRNNFIVDYHVTYALALIYLSVVRAGCYWGLDGWLERSATLKSLPWLKFRIAH